MRGCLTALGCILLAGLVIPAQAQQPAPREEPAPQTEFPEIPHDALWTIYCQALAGPTRVEQANLVKQQLIQTTNMKDWYVIHEEGQSVLYYGFYRAIDESDPKDAARARADRQRIEELADRLGDPLFKQVMFVQITTPDPPAPQEWNLVNADGYWSLQIAAYKDSPRRKEYAVEAVKEARAQGIPAYYYHGETTSSVCVGAWPRSAVKEQEEAEGRSPDPTQDVLILPRALPPGATADFRNREGQPMRVLVPRFEPVDPSLIEAMERYPHHAVNGLVPITRIRDPLTGRVSEVMDRSFLVLIPRRSPSILRGPVAPPPAADTAVAAPPAAPPGGRLRSIED